jgi:uncharacterized protein (TIGR02284 family)
MLQSRSGSRLPEQVDRHRLIAIVIGILLRSDSWSHAVCIPDAYPYPWRDHGPFVMLIERMGHLRFCSCIRCGLTQVTQKERKKMNSENTSLAEGSITKLRKALQTNAEFYHAAAINSAHGAIASILRMRAQERMELAEELDDESAQITLPQRSDGGDGLLPALRRGWLTISAGMTIASKNVDKRVLQEAQEADARLIGTYQEVLADDTLPQNVCKQIAAQYEQVQATYAFTGTRLNRQFDSMVMGLFARQGDLRTAMRALHTAGVEQEQIAVIGNEAVVENILGDRKAELASSSAGVAAIGGTLLGGFLGFMAGLGTVMLPGIGSVLAVSATATVVGSTAIGAGIGAAQASFLGVLLGFGVAEEDTHRYATGVKNGELLLAVQVPADFSAGVAETLRNQNAMDVSVRVDEHLQEAESP